MNELYEYNSFQDTFISYFRECHRRAEENDSAQKRLYNYIQIHTYQEFKGLINALHGYSVIIDVELLSKEGLLLNYYVHI